MSEYNSRYTGEQIDEAVGKILGIDIKDNAFVVLESSETNPFDLDQLTVPKNYMVFYYTNGAPDDTFKRRPISVYVRELSHGDIIEQVYVTEDKVYARTKLKSDIVWGEWGINSSYYEELAKILSTYPTINYNPVYFSETDPIQDHPELNNMPYVWMKITNRSQVE